MERWLPIIVRKKCMCGVLGDCIPEARKQIQQLGYEVSEEEVRAHAEQDIEASFTQGVCVLDEGHPLEAMQRPQGFERPKIPVCLKRAWEELYIPYRTKQDLAQIMRISRGEHLPKEKYDLAEWQTMQREAHNLPVVVRLCAKEGCTAELVVTVGAAAAAIERHNLLDDPAKFYEPSVFCMQHRRERDAARRSAEDGGDEESRTPPRNATPSAVRPHELAEQVAQHVLARLSQAAPTYRLRHLCDCASGEVEVIPPLQEDATIAQGD